MPVMKMKKKQGGTKDEINRKNYNDAVFLYNFHWHFKQKQQPGKEKKNMAHQSSGDGQKQHGQQQQQRKVSKKHVTALKHETPTFEEALRRFSAMKKQKVSLQRWQTKKNKV